MHNAVNTARSYTRQVNAIRGKPQQDDTGFVDSGCSRHMTRNIAHLSDSKEFDGGYVTFGGGTHGGRISGTQGDLNAGCWYVEPKSVADDIRQVKDGPHNESDDKDKLEDDSSPKEDNY
ncbi:hypothetical protein Tco_1073769 [Tanacetum coccineum]